MVPRRLDGSGVEAGVERNGTRTEGGVYHTTRPLLAVVVRVFRPRASVPIRASGDRKDGSDPPPTFCRWRGSANGGGCGTRCTAGCTTPPQPSWGSLPSSCLPAGRLPRPHAGGTTSRNDRPDA